jgi:hypothetical protein
MISCILICKEPEYPKLVLERLDLGFFDEIVIETNCPHIYRRYELAKKANNSIIFTMDDDCLVNYQVLFRHYNGQITNTMTKPFIPHYEKMGCTLVGWGCYFPKSMLTCFDKYIERYGEDDPHLLREADRIFTLLNKPFNTIIMPHEDLFQNDENRMSSPKNIDFHFASAYEAIRKTNLL